MQQFLTAPNRQLFSVIDRTYPSGRGSERDVWGGAGKMSETKAFERLPADVVPRNYKLELTPDLKAFTFKGHLEITAQVRPVVV